MNYRIQSCTVISLLGLLLLASCSDNPSDFSEEPPQLPPVSSMEFDFSTFENNNATNATQSSNNFNRAFVSVSVMKAFIDLHLIFPRILLTAAAQHEAEFNDEGKWEWAYSHTRDGENYAVRLIASRQDGNVEWALYLTNSVLGLDDVLFFEGITNETGTEGTWVYYGIQSDSQQPTSQIEWGVHAEDDISLKLTVLQGVSEEAGNTIEYTFDGSVKTAVYYDAAADETTTIAWNVETKAGYIIAPDYNNGEKSCWNSSFQDVQCSEITI